MPVSVPIVFWLLQMNMKFKIEKKNVLWILNCMTLLYIHDILLAIRVQKPLVNKDGDNTI